MLMKKHLIAALVGVMILAVTAPAFAANVGGNLEFGYEYDLVICRAGCSTRSILRMWCNRRIRVFLCGMETEHSRRKDGRGYGVVDADYNSQVCRSRPLLSGGVPRPSSRSRRGRSPDSTPAGLEAVGREPTPDEAAVLAETVTDLLQQLNGGERTIVELSLQGYSTQEISEQTGRAERSVRRLRERVRRHLEQQ